MDGYDICTPELFLQQFPKNDWFWLRMSQQITEKNQHYLTSGVVQSGLVRSG